MVQSGLIHLAAIRLPGFLRLALVCMLLVIGSAGPAPILAAPNTLVRDTLIVGVSEENITGLDPSIDTSLDGYVVTGQIYETLTTYDAGAATLIPALASSWTATNDFKDWTFTLRTGVTFQDGTPLNADAVRFNFERWWDPAHPYHGTSTVYPYFRDSFLYKGDPAGSLINGIDVSTDKTQVIFRLSQSYNVLPERLSHPAFAIASPQAIMAGTLSTHPVGTGAYKFSTWDTINRTILLTANLAYTGAQPFIPNILFKQFGTPQEQAEAIIANTLHVAYGIPNAFYDTARQDMNIHVTWQLGSNIGYLGMNRGRGPLTDLRVRQAIAHAIDKQSLIANYYDPVDQVASQFLPPELWGYKPGMADYPYNPALARTLLADAGYPRSFLDPTITIEYRTVNRIYLRNPGATAMAIKRQLEAVGLQVGVLEYDSGEFIDRIGAGLPEMFLLGWGGDYPHPDDFFSPHFCTNMNQAFGPRDDTFCAALEATLAKTDEAAQLIDYRNASQYVHDQLRVVPLAHGRNMILVRSEVAGLEKASFVPETFRTVFWADGPNEIFRPDQPGSLKVSGYQTATTTISMPAGAVEDKIILSYTLEEAGAASVTQKPAKSPTAMQALQAVNPPAGLQQAAPGFRLSVYKNKVLQPDLQFTVPIDIAIDSRTLTGTVHLRGLVLYAWDGSQWKEATTTCASNTVPQVDVANATLHTPICTTGLYTLFEKPLVFLPILRR